MLDDLRKEADQSGFFDDSAEESFQEISPDKRGYFLGITPFQRFFLALLLLLITFLLSSFCLLATNRMVLPFL